MGFELEPSVTDPLRGAKPDTELSDPLRQLRVLVVDDEPLIRWSIGATLAALGHRVLEAVDAASTRHLLEHLDRPVDVVLLDYRLPDSDDLRLLEDIRRMTPHSAVVMMTAFGALDIAPAARALGVHVVIEKPFDVRTLEPELMRAYSSRTS